jgi:hypothetical protein
MPTTKQKLVLYPCGEKGLRVESPDHVDCVFIDLAPDTFGVTVRVCLRPDQADAIAAALIRCAHNAQLLNNLETVKKSAEFSRERYAREIAALEHQGTNQEAFAHL